MEIVTIEKNDLQNLMRSVCYDAALSAFAEWSKSKSLEGSESTLLTRMEVAEMFSVTLPTIHSWMNSGVLPFHRIGGRTVFKKMEVINAMKQVKIRRRSILR